MVSIGYTTHMIISVFALTTGLAAVYGAVLGSFLNVVINRGIADESIGGRSRCPRCKTGLRWVDMVPIISFGVLRGRCRTCQDSISVQYPLVEALMAVLTVLLLVPVPESLLVWMQQLLLVGVCAALVVLLVTDWRTMLLPDTYLWWLSGFVGLVLVVRGVVSGDYTGVVIAATAGAALGAGMLGLLWLGTRGRGIGLGDVKLLLPLGALLGSADTILLLFIAFMSGGAVAAVLLATKRAGMKTAIPFGPFLIGAALLIVCLPQVADSVAYFAFGGYL